MNIALLLLMFVSPIRYTIDMVPTRARASVPEPLDVLDRQFRFALIGMRGSPLVHGAFLLACATAAAVSGAFFRRMSPIFSDYE